MLAICETLSREYLAISRQKDSAIKSLNGVSRQSSFTLSKADLTIPKIAKQVNSDAGVYSLNRYFGRQALWKFAFQASLKIV